MDLVIRISKEDLLKALLGNGSDAPVATVVTPSPKKAKPAKAAPVESDEFEETEEEETPAAKPSKKTKAKPAPVAPPVEDDEEEEESEEEAEEEEESEEEESEEEDEFITGDDLAKLKKALNAHKAANGGKPKKTLEILRKFAPGGSEKVKPDIFPKLLKALKV